MRRLKWAAATVALVVVARKRSRIWNTLKTKHDTVKNSLANIR
jgi:hypothetical protein